MKKLSIITISLNNSKGLRKTIVSVINQTFKDFEYIVIDGDSTDGSIEIIKEYSKYIIYWVSEKDSGIYNAMNKGIRKAKGEYLFFLNSGDYFYNEEVLENVFKKKYLEDIIYGDLIFDYGNNIQKHVAMPEKITFKYMMENTIYHQSAFIKKKIFDSYGLYNEDNRIVSDWEHFFKSIILNNVTTIHLNEIISFFDFTGISSKIENKDFVYKEREKVLKRLVPIYVIDFYNEYIDTVKMYDELYNANIMKLYRWINKNKLIRILLYAPYKGYKKIKKKIKRKSY